ncbi:S26 family signal peptidase [Nocardioides sp. GXQ0305]|uniref:S26 family signal peptidase n=1 Tax=Nocardioides sp. GXQ0305 TaxID=3423912 RepID=UPI003D7E705C
MEITTRPRSHRWRRVASRMSLLTVLLALLLLLPASLGLDQRVVTDSSMGGSLSRGTLTFERPVGHADQLRVGDVISFPQPGDPAGARVTRRVISIEGTTVVTRGDAMPTSDPWVLDAEALESSLAVFTIPFVGYPQVLVPWLTWAVLALLLAAASLALVVVARREAARERRTRSTGPGGATAVAA